jgi:hypothetical protein
MTDIDLVVLSVGRDGGKQKGDGERERPKDTA